MNKLNSSEIKVERLKINSMENQNQSSEEELMIAKKNFEEIVAENVLVGSKETHLAVSKMKNKLEHLRKLRILHRESREDSDPSQSIKKLVDYLLGIVVDYLTVVDDVSYYLVEIFEVVILFEIDHHFKTFETYCFG
ncbi:uncharacterized protein MELLADRAFT_67203 [Melampsora larici-populina 98AG31]|uniref:Uncharacterized protein n=1 Tax=Melampsora larici-populina (strain 98AG31 / pathotype 3-4-7) TaxID=747676 RepID=F4S264_MELLP|nr:uncharacterized protein MELLADRAFT_67203 [Melampsora larici-populina 98AG31]EGG01310.1 hypothetical protein MELLADRAFT_67203 [Melampsora larici-populina 98AG31]